jgi:hypothetical protein
MMKRFMILATAALLSSGAFAQKFKERVSVGATLPADVRLSPVPADWGPSVSKYQYVYSDDHVFLVEPSSRRVVTVID